MTPRNHYDVIVLGGQLAGLMAAIVLVRRGHRVLVADCGEAAGGYLRRGYWYPLVPQWVPCADREELQRSWLREQGLPEPAAPDGPLFQVAWPRQRLDVYAAAAEGERAALAAAELQRVFAGSAPLVERWLEQLDQQARAVRDLLLGPASPLLPSGLWDRLRRRAWAAGVARQLPPDWLDVRAVPAAWRDFIAAAGPLHQYQDPNPGGPSAGTALTLPGLWHAPSVLPDDVAGLPGLLRRRLIELGGEWASSAVHSLAVDGRRVRGVRLDGVGHAPSADVWVLATYSRALDAWLSGRRAGALLAEAEQAPPRTLLWVEHVLARREVLPEGMAPRVYVLEEDQPAGADEEDGDERRVSARWIEWEHPRRADLEGTGATVVERDEARVLFTVRGLVPWRALQRPDTAAGLRQGFWSALARVVPFLGEHLVDRASALELDGWGQGSRAPALPPRWHYPRYARRADDPLAVSGLPVATPYANLLRCGADTLPGLGLEGEWVTAQHVADRVAQLLR